MNASGPIDGHLPFVSMVIANRVSPFLLEALESIHQQSYAAMEIIVLDDGSPDREAFDTVLKRFPDVVVLHQPPSGLSIARNVGLSRARGSLVGFFDDDDRYPTDWVDNPLWAGAVESAADDEALLRHPAGLCSTFTVVHDRAWRAQFHREDVGHE